MLEWGLRWTNENGRTGVGDRGGVDEVWGWGERDGHGSSHLVTGTGR